MPACSPELSAASPSSAMTWWTFRYFFFCSGRGKGESEAPGGGGCRFLLKPGGFSRRGGAEGPGGCLQRIGEFGGGWGKMFFSRPKCPPR